MPNPAPNAFTPLSAVLGYSRNPARPLRPLLSPLIAPSLLEPKTGESASDPQREPEPKPLVLDALPLAPAKPIESHGTALAADVRCFRARLADALENATHRLTADFAVALLGRELELAPVAIERIAARVLADFWNDAPLRLRISAFDGPVDDLDLEIVVDPALRAGDCVVELADGSHDASLGIRLAAVVERACSR